MRLITGIAILALGFGVVTCANKAKTSINNDVVAVSEGKVGIDFSDISLEEAKTLAKKKKKIIFIDAYASWCGPCKMLDKNTFSDASVGTYFNDKFINLKIDCEKHPDGRKVASTYSVSAYPTLIWIDADGNLVKKEVGYKSPEQLLKAVQDLK